MLLYFMPSISFSIDDSLKVFYMKWILNNKDFYLRRCIKAHELLLDATEDDPKISLDLPSPDIICEYFNRETLS